jgi:hypothetical protein
MPRSLLAAQVRWIARGSALALAAILAATIVGPAAAAPPNSSTTSVASAQPEALDKPNAQALRMLKDLQRASSAQSEGKISAQKVTLPCNPQNAKKYCSPNPKGYFQKYLAKARADAIKHKDAKWRKNVPFPNIDTLYSRLDGFGAVYVITGRRTGFIGPVSAEGSVYKFGYTRGELLFARPAASLLKCNRDKVWQDCKVEVIAITRYQNGGYHARWLEAAAFVKYKRSLGHCPDGAKLCR